MSDCLAHLKAFVLLKEFLLSGWLFISLKCLNNLIHEDTEKVKIQPLGSWSDAIICDIHRQWRNSQKASISRCLFLWLQDIYTGVHSGVDTLFISNYFIITNKNVMLAKPSQCLQFSDWTLVSFNISILLFFQGVYTEATCFQFWLDLSLDLCI